MGSALSSFISIAGKIESVHGVALDKMRVGCESELGLSFDGSSGQPKRKILIAKSVIPDVWFIVCLVSFSIQIAFTPRLLN